MSEDSFEENLLETVMCDVCGITAQPDDVLEDSFGHRACGECQDKCENCTDQWAVERDEGGHWCGDCAGERMGCEWCGDMGWLDDMYAASWGYRYCERCWDNRCRSCEEVFGLSPGQEYCGDCAESYEMSEEYQENFDYTVESFEVREFAQIRGPMKVSYELEFAREPEILAQKLYDAGLSEGPGIGSYSAPVNTAVVKYDGSVDGGGELVGSRFMLPRQDETDRFWRVFEVLRNSVKEGDHALDMRCGLHIHVDATTLPLSAVMSTAVAFNYLEDILYRLSAANWKGHRSASGNDYAKVSEKDINSKERFRHMFGDRYLGLNLSNYLQNRYSCTCGAGFDRADLCTCVKRKMTIEYRLFNTTGNHIKMHGYTALACALVSFGKDKELLAADLPPMAYNYVKPKQADLEDYVERLRWMFEVLPLSAEERQSIRYLIRNCELGPLLMEHKDADTVVRGILEDDNDLRIPVFIAVRQDDMVMEAAPQQPFMPPAITSATRIDEYGEFVFPNPAIPAGEQCNNTYCRQCWTRHTAQQVAAYQRGQSQDRWTQPDRVEEQAPVFGSTMADDYPEDVAPPSYYNADVQADLSTAAAERCDCYDCRSYLVQQDGYYRDANGRWHGPNGRFCPNPTLLDPPTPGLGMLESMLSEYLTAETFQPDMVTAASMAIQQAANQNNPPSIDWSQFEDAVDVEF